MQNKVLIFMQKILSKALKFESLYLHLLTNQRLHTEHNISLILWIDKILFVSLNIEDQKSK